MSLDPKQTGGVDFSEFSPIEGRVYSKQLLYYKDGELTNKFFIKNVHLYDGEKFIKNGEHKMYLYNYKLSKVGDFVSTCPIKGTCFSCGNEELAFGKIIRIYPCSGYNDGGSLVGEADVVFL